MQVLACNSHNLHYPSRSIVKFPRRNYSRQELCFDGISTVSSKHDADDDYDSDGDDDVSSESTLLQRNHTDKLGQVISGSVLFTKRRALFASLFVYSWYHPSRYLSAYALGDPSLTIEEVSPPVFPSGPLYPTEGRIVQLFEKNTYSVVNIFDVTLRPQLNVTGVVEVPEGNGSGVVYSPVLEFNRVRRKLNHN